MVGLTRFLMRGSRLENPAIPLTDPLAMRELFGSYESDTGEIVGIDRALTHSPLWQGVMQISGGIGVFDRFPKGDVPQIEQEQYQE